MNEYYTFGIDLRPDTKYQGLDTYLHNVRSVRNTNFSSIRFRDDNIIQKYSLSIILRWAGDKRIGQGDPTP